jgi:hypothetical protein
MFIRTRWFAAALAALAFAQAVARGDYYDSGNAYTRYGRVIVTTYPTDPAAPGIRAGLFPEEFHFGRPKFGQAQIVFDGGWLGVSGAYPTALDTIAFNTDLPLSPNQIIAPKGWSVTPNAVVPGLGRFSWQLHTSNPGESLVPIAVTIDGLGSNPAASHFWLPSTGMTPSGPPPAFAFHYNVINELGPDLGHGWYFVGVPQSPETGWYSVDTRLPFASVTSTPEPSTLILCSLAIGGLVGRRGLARLRRRPSS